MKGNPTRLPGHALVAEGAPHLQNDCTAEQCPLPRRPLQGSDLADPHVGGHARCSCGEQSGHLPSGKQRRAWHKDVHKPAVRQALGEVTGRAFDGAADAAGFLADLAADAGLEADEPDEDVRTGGRWFTLRDGAGVEYYVLVTQSETKGETT